MVFNELRNIEAENCSPRVLQKLLCEFLCSIEPKGFLTCLGFRTSIGSIDTMLPPDRLDLEYMYTRLNKPLDQ